jgi:hypothetical protein
VAAALVSRLGLIALVAVGSALVARQVAPAPQSQKLDESKEPALEFSLDHDGTTTSLVLDQSTDIKTGHGVVAVTLHMKESRTLRLAGASFDYPADFAFSYDGSDSATPSWSLKHEDTTIRIIRLTLDSDASKAALSLVTTLQGEKVGHQEKPKATKLVTRNVALDGYKGKFVDGEDAVSLEAYGFKANGVVHVVLVQDGPNDHGQESKDHVEVMKLLTNTFKIEQRQAK